MKPFRCALISIVVLVAVPAALSESVKSSVQGEAPGEKKLTSQKAGEIALRHFKDGRIYRIKLGKEKGKPAYEVNVITKDNHLKAVDLDAVSGEVLSVEDEAVVLGYWPFDDVPLGKLPPKWIVGQNNPTKSLARWAVAAVPDAPTYPKVLNVMTDNDNATYNYSFVDGSAFKDLDLRVQVRGNTGKFDQGGGLIWRAKNGDNYYTCRINPLEPNYRVYKVENGKRTQLQTAEAKTETGKWYALRVVMVDDHITCYLDGKKVLEVKDDTFKTEGMIGLWTKADASSSFDNLLILKPDRSASTTKPAK